MITHILQTFSKVRYHLNKEQAALIQEMVDHKEEFDANPYVTIGGGRVHIGSIEGIHPIEMFPNEIENEQAYNRFPQLPEPKNRFTRQENIQRMKVAAYEAKKTEQEKHGIQSWSTPLENWLPEKYQVIPHSMA